MIWIPWLLFVIVFSGIDLLLVQPWWNQYELPGRLQNSTIKPVQGEIMSSSTTASPNLEVMVVSQEMALLSNIMAACNFIAGTWVISQKLSCDFLMAAMTGGGDLFLSVSLSQANPRGQRWCFWAVCARASSSHSALSSSRYTVERTATMATVSILSIATGAGITVTVTAAPTTISLQTLIQTAWPWFRLEAPRLLGTASQRTGMGPRTCQHGGADALSELSCTLACLHQQRVFLSHPPRDPHHTHTVINTNSHDITRLQQEQKSYF